MQLKMYFLLEDTSQYSSQGEKDKWKGKIAGFGGWKNQQEDIYTKIYRDILFICKKHSGFTQLHILDEYFMAPSYTSDVSTSLEAISS